MFRHDPQAERLQESQKKTQHDKFFREYYKYENRIDEVRLQCKLREEEKEALELEAAMSQDLRRKQKLAKEAAKRELDFLEEEKLMDIFRDQKKRQYIRENSSELRELETKLKMAYVSKIRQSQICRKELEKAKAKGQEAEERKLLDMQIEASQIEELIEEERNSLNKTLYQKELLHQARINREMAEEEAMIQFIKDKAMIDEITKQIMLEDQQYLEDEFRKRERFQEDIRRFLLSQEIQRQEEQRRIEEENIRILDYLEETDERQKELHKKLIEKVKKAQQVQELVYKNLEKCQKDTREEEDLRLEIEMAKQEAEQNAKEKQALERLVRERLKLRYTLDEQLKFKERIIEAEKIKDAEFRRQMAIKLAEEAKLDQMTAQKRRIKQMEHRREIEQMITQNQQQRELEKQQEEEELENLRRAMKQRQQIIADERLKLLKEHAHKLLGFLPKGIVKQSEWEALQGTADT